MIVQPTPCLGTQPFPDLPNPNSATRRPEISGNDIWTELTGHEMYDPRITNGLELLFSQASEGGLETDSLQRKETVSNGFSALSLLGIGNTLTPSFMSLPRDRLGASKLCRVYLQNVDPIIKILHRPSLSKWMLDGASTYLGTSEDNNSVRALASAVCYVAANTMTEAQCQATFQQNKSSITTVYRRMCESAFEKAGLLTTRDMTVLQAFILYLIARRSEDKDTAVWALIALAVRLARAMGLNQENEQACARESFFQQQMRLRLWLTVCLVDLQTSFSQASEPLITHSGAACAIPNVAHINDSDFDMDTEHPVAPQEQLMDTTFALVTYHVQVAGRVLNFGSPECSTAAERHKLAREVQQQVFTLLHYCDPESSPYAWFTWHSTQSIVSAIRLSELLPFRCSQPGSCASVFSPRVEGDTILLRLALRNLEKAQLLCTDPRGSGFRWYITTPYLALSTAISECSTCSDVETVRRAWPVIEASYRQHDEFPISHDCQSAQAHLVQMMNETREKLSSLLQESGTGFNVGQAVEIPATDSLVPLVSAGNNPIDPLLSDPRFAS